MLSFSSLLEPLRMANKVSASHLYEWKIFSINNESVAANNTLLFSPTCDISEISDLDFLFVVAGTSIHEFYTPIIRTFLRKVSAFGIKIGATSTGTFLLAFSRIIGEKECTVHWEYMDMFVDEFPRIKMTGDIFEIQGDILTCCGGLSGLDLMLELIREQQSADLSKAIADQYLYPEIRDSDTKQKMDLISRYNIHNPRLLRAIQLMESNTRNPVSLSDISEHANLSERHLQRLFGKYLNKSANEFYLKIRLEKSYKMLKETDLSILSTAIACGFNSSSYFSKRFKLEYGLIPREVRKSIR